MIKLFYNGTIHMNIVRVCFEQSIFQNMLFLLFVYQGYSHEYKVLTQF